MAIQEDIFETLASVARALGSGPRLTIIVKLAQSNSSVENIAQSVGLTVANTSQHLQQLRRAGLVSGTRSGKQMIYHLTDDRIVNLIDLIRQIAETNLAEMERLVSQLFHYSDADSPLLPVTMTELQLGLEQGNLTLIDVRPSEEFNNGHLPNAINIPLEELQSKLYLIAKQVDIVAYCRGPYCAMSHKAVEDLSKLGYNVRRFKDGYPEWKAAGLPIDIPAAIKNVDQATADL
jgi:ArsR family transcriptional regulator